MPLYQLPKDLSDIQEDTGQLAYASKCINGIAKYDSRAGAMVRYLGEFITLKCAPDMLALHLFPNAKEISESFGCYNAVRRYLQELPLGDPNITLIAVGDGVTPRTAATFALRTKWQCHSIDPLLKGGTKKWEVIQRLTLHVNKVENVPPIKCETAVIVAVHSHANLQKAILVANAPTVYVVAIPCCVQQKLSVPPDRWYSDKGIISPKRDIYIWKNVSQCQEFTQ